MENLETFIIKPSSTGPDLTDVCPLCNAVVKLFYINLEEKMLMCANAECEFPFGHEELVFVKFDETSKIASDQDFVSTRSRHTQETLSQEMPNGSIVSEGGWSDIENINKAFCMGIDDTEMSSFESKAVDPKEYMNCKTMKKPQILPKEDEKMKKTLEKIKEIDKNLQEFQEQGQTYIKNRDLLKQLRDVQRESQERFKKVCLFKPGELTMIKNEEPAPFVVPQVKVDIQTNEHNLPTININIEAYKEENKE